MSSFECFHEAKVLTCTACRTAERHAAHARRDHFPSMVNVQQLYLLIIS